MSTVKEEVIVIIAEYLGIPEEEVTMESNIKDDLGADSLDQVEILMALEEHFGIDIDDMDDADELKVSQFIEKIEVLVKEAG